MIKVSLRVERMLGIPSLYLKREDLHPLGSHKGRSLPYMIDKGLEEGLYRFAISSSGNGTTGASDRSGSNRSSSIDAEDV